MASTTRTRPRARTPRRSTEEVRGLTLDAAARLFAANGYRQTTMRAIAGEAGISLSVLYRQFPSKERLFSATFVAPFAESFERFSAIWSERTGRGSGGESGVGELVRELHEGLLTHRRTVVTLLAAGEDPDAELVEEARVALSDAWRDLLRAAPRISGSDQSPEQVRDVMMLVVAMVSGLVLFDPWVSVARGDNDTEALVALAVSLADEMMKPANSSARVRLSG